MFATVQKKFGALRPSNSDAEELIKSLKDGIDYTVEVKRTRNLKFHRLYWLLCTIVSENLPDNVSKEGVSDYIKIESGHVRLEKIGGVLHQFPKSISFSAMTAEEWATFWDKAVEVCCQKVIPGLDKEELELELFELLR